MNEWITIIGKGLGWELEPQNGSTCWGVNDLILRRPVDVAFNMHDLEWNQAIIRANLDPRLPYKDETEKDRIAEETYHHRKRVVEIVNEHKLPLYSIRTYDHIPTSIAYPLAEIIDTFGEDYLTSGIDYMLALAIHRDVARIDLYGVTMMGPYDGHRQGVEFWLGVALGRDIPFKIHGEHKLLKTVTGKLYGYGIKQGSL
jgi:hypothetical protein